MLETARDQDFPYLQQISFFLPNKVGSLERVAVALGEESVRICGMSMLDAHDHAVVRLIVDDPGKAEKLLASQGRSLTVTRVLGVAVDSRRVSAVADLLGAVMQAEINVYYAYALLSRIGDEAIVAVHADDVDIAARALRRGGFDLVSQRDLGDS